MKRQEYLKQSKETLEEAQLSFQVEQDKLQLQADLLETQRQLSSKEQKLVKLKSAKTLSASDIIECADEIKGLKAGVKALRALEKELF